MKLGGVLAVVAIFLPTTLVASVEGEDTEASQQQVAKAHPLLEAIEDGKNPSHRDGKLFAFRTTTSITRIATTTTLALSTCITAVNAAACNGRRKRGLLNAGRIPFLKEDEGTDISSSINLEGSEDIAADLDRAGKKLTWWSTAYTTVTVTSTSFFPGLTVTVSLACNPGGATNSCFG